MRGSLCFPATFLLVWVVAWTPVPRPVAGSELLGASSPPSPPLTLQGKEADFPEAGAGE